MILKGSLLPSPREIFKPVKLTKKMNSNQAYNLKMLCLDIATELSNSRPEDAPQTLTHDVIDALESNVFTLSETNKIRKAK